MDDQQVAAMFPKEWAAVANVTGERARRRRHSLRRRARVETALAQLRAEGRSCASCGSFRNQRPCPGGPRTYCERDSDFHGYAIVKPTDLCTNWHAGEAPMSDLKAAARDVEKEFEHG